MNPKKKKVYNMWFWLDRMGRLLQVGDFHFPNDKIYLMKVFQLTTLNE